MLEQLLLHHPAQQQVWPVGFEGGIVHRLDVATSGQLLVAKTPEVLSTLRTDFTQKRLRKHYRFLTTKDVTWKEHEITFALAHHKSNRRKMVVQRGRNTPHRGKWIPAVTRFQYIDSKAGLHLWQATMSTGVMHQIRLHAAIAGLALLGDTLYGGGETPSYFPSDFALHHCGIESTKWNVPVVPIPNWWPEWTHSC